jgi:XRE family aerobic/anaerobic benzoate catabolism transcriptional regulator
MVEPKTSPQPGHKAPERAGAGVESEADFVAEIGHRVRLGRAKRGMTRRQLAQGSGASERYLAQIEAGQGNPSVIILKSIARALDLSIAELLPREARADGVERIIELLGRVPPPELSAVAEMIEQRAAQTLADDRARRIALVGLRGAGKSTLGQKLAAHLGCPFIELNLLVEQEYGASIPDLIEIAGITTFRRYERTCLEHVIAQNEAAVIATAGGIVANAETYALLLRRAHTIWIRARPEEHMRRVIEQGDFRPMAQNREAMADLVAILDARRPDYARAEAELDTSGDDMQASFAKLAQITESIVGGAAVPSPSPLRGRSTGEAGRERDR